MQHAGSPDSLCRHCSFRGPDRPAATTTIPIVFFGNFDPVAARFVQSLARPGRNVTGVLIAPEGTLGAKKLVATRPDALFVMADTYFWSDRRPVIARTLQQRLASMWEWREQVQEGGLMSYGTSLMARWERVASYVDLVLKGAKPGETPVDRPTNLGLALNLATAKAIGLTVPQSLVLRVDEVIR